MAETSMNNTPMNESRSNRVRELCSLIQVEQNEHRFVKLIEELNRLLSEKGTHSLSDFHSDNNKGGDSNGGERTPA
jgi:hypothetical protein